MQSDNRSCGGDQPKLVEEQLAAREAALGIAEQVHAQAEGQQMAMLSSVHIPPHEEKLQVVAAHAPVLAGVRKQEASSMEPEWSSCDIIGCRSKH